MTPFEQQIDIINLTTNDFHKAEKDIMDFL